MDSGLDKPLLSEQEQQQLLDEFTGPNGSFPIDRCFHELFEEQVVLTPDAPALVFGAERYSYLELNQRANQLAHYLRGAGVKANVRVALVLERSAAMIVAMLGILKAGGVYVPLAASLPEARLAALLADAAPALVVTQESLLARLSSCALTLLCLDRDAAKFDAQPTGNPPNVTTGSDGIYIIFTSGSTGAPKGVLTRQDNIVNYAHGMCAQLGLDVPGRQAGLVFANVSTLAADLGNTTIFAALASGGCLHVIGDDVLMDGDAYGKYSTAHAIDVIKIAPSHLRALMQSGDPARILPRKFLITGGERLRWEMVREIRKASNCAIVNHYAPTEATIGCLMCRIEPGGELERLSAVAPLGKPIPNMTAMVLDENQRLVPYGVAGELYLGGAGIAGGYLNRPELTEARFLSDPVRPASGLRFYRTGDRSRFLPGGYIEFLGREDDQVKIRGFRVELGEVEAVLSRQPEVKQAVVLARESAAGDQSLAACVVSNAGLTANTLRDFLSTQLPDYMVPATFVFLDSIPLSGNGKVDRQALGSQVDRLAAAEVPAEVPAAAADPLEQKLLAIWREVLRRDDIGVNDNFFQSGGHSLMATLVIFRVRTAFDVQIPIRALFEAPTVAGLAALVRNYQPEPEDTGLAQILNELEGLSDDDARRLLEE